MNFSLLKRASAVLRHGPVIEEAGGLLKVAGKGLDTAVHAAKAFDRAGAEAARFLVEKGHPLLAAGARVAPYAGALYGGKRVYESEPVQRARAKIQEWKYRRALKRQGMM